ncbi:MAG: DUF5591 domain-containing protein, partial [Promethearchaeota archaeon]
NSYDISVTGNWDEEEKKITSEMLLSLLIKYNKLIPIICHLEGESLEIVKKINNNLEREIFFSVVKENPTSNESLQVLKELIQEHIKDYNPNKEMAKGNYLSKTWNRKFIKILDYQFGIGSGNKIIKNDLILKKNKANNRIHLHDKNTKQNIGTFNASTGQVSITINGMKRITQKPFSLDSNMIIFDGESIRGNNLFRIGILDYSLDLVPGNFVAVIDKFRNNIIGVGKLFVGANHLKNSKSGKVVEIYEKR